MNAEMDISKNQWRSTGGKSVKFFKNFQSEVAGCNGPGKIFKNPAIVLTI